jgi:hypothetical protein
MGRKHLLMRKQGVVSTITKAGAGSTGSTINAYISRGVSMRVISQYICIHSRQAAQVHVRRRRPSLPRLPQAPVPPRLGLPQALLLQFSSRTVQI